MDKLKIAEMLGVHPYGAFWVRDIHLFGWGSEIAFDCLYEPGAPADPIPFQLVLHDCRDIQWRVYAHLKSPDDPTTSVPATSLVNVRLGSDHHRKPLQLLTDAFGITVTYETLRVEANGKPIPPSPFIPYA